jgi:hypothetical protein
LNQISNYYFSQGSNFGLDFKDLPNLLNPFKNSSQKYSKTFFLFLISFWPKPPTPSISILSPSHPFGPTLTKQHFSPPSPSQPCAGLETFQPFCPSLAHLPFRPLPPDDRTTFPPPSLRHHTTCAFCRHPLHHQMKCLLPSPPKNGHCLPSTQNGRHADTSMSDTISPLIATFLPLTL